MQDYLSDLYKKLSGKMKLGRQRAEQLMDALDHPEKSFRSIHVAGTNGKGTVTVVAAALLEATGFRTGRFTSPHLMKFNERICVNREEIPDDYIKEFLQRYDQLFEKTEASFFEVTTALGFLYFRDRHVDAAVIETGLGGRLDATSVITPRVSVITRIGLDHTGVLGETLPEIAGEKAGIIKKDIPLLTPRQPEEVLTVFRAHTENIKVIDPASFFSDVDLTKNGMTFFIGSCERKFNIPLTGRHQLENIALAIRVVEILLDRRLDPAEIQAGFNLVKWKGRFEKLSEDPDVIYDVAHNSDSIHMFCITAKEIYPGKKISVVLGLLRDKSPEKVLMELALIAGTIRLAPVNSHRSMNMEELNGLANRFPRVKVSTSITSACKEAYAETDEHSVLCILGSHYIAEEVYDWKNKKP